MPFWPFRRRISDPSLKFEELQSQLARAGHSSRRQLRRFCRAYRTQIEANVDKLVLAPPGFDADSPETQQFIHGLATAAQCLATECNSPALWQALTGTADNNPILRWQQFLEFLPERLQRLEFEQVREEILVQLEDIKRFQGPHAKQYEAIALGRLGEACFHSGRVSEAGVPTQRALEICRLQDDRHGVAIYLANLIEIARYAGDAAGAIQWAEQLHDELMRQGRHAEAADVARQLTRLRAGEPFCRLVCRKNDRVFELDELQPVADSSYCFEFVRNRPSLHTARGLTEQGKAKGARGELAEALELFQRAANIDPYDPDPAYQSGVALMDLGAFGQAKAAFAQAEARAPGWFNCRRDRWLAEQLDLGGLPSEVWTILRSTLPVPR